MSANANTKAVEASFTKEDPMLSIPIRDFTHLSEVIYYFGMFITQHHNLDSQDYISTPHKDHHSINI